MRYNYQKSLKKKKNCIYYLRVKAKKRSSNKDEVKEEFKKLKRVAKLKMGQALKLTALL